MVNKIFESKDEDFVKLIKTSTCVKEVLFKLGYTTNGNSWGYTQIKNRMSILNLKNTDFKGKKQINNPTSEINNKDLFTKNNKPRNLVRHRILRDNLIPYKCDICGTSEWQGKKLNLDLDHINGINNDHRLENLRFLCPNCHSQTSTYGAKNKDLYIKDFEITEDMKTKVITEYNKVKNKLKVSKNLGYKKAVVQEILNMCGLTKPNLKHVIRYDKNNIEMIRFGSISEACQYLMDNNEVTTKIMKTCRNTFLRNCNNFWLKSYWTILDA